MINKLMSRRVKTCVGRAALILGLLGVNPALMAHPHVWIEVHNAITLDDQQRIISIEAYWRFDELYSAFAIQGLDANNDGIYSSKELHPILQDNLEEMQKTKFYTHMQVNDQAQSYGQVEKAETSFEDGYLIMRFSLPLLTPVATAENDIKIATYDPSYYIAMNLAEQQPASLLGPSIENCQVAIKRPRQAEAPYLEDSIATTETDVALKYALQFTAQISVKCTQ